MVQQESQTDAHSRKTREGNKKSPGKLPFKPSKGKEYSNKYPNNNNQQKGNDPKKKKVTNDEDCPIYGTSHKWGQCHQNQYGRIFVLVDLLDPQLLILPSEPLDDPLFTMDCLLKYKSIPTKIDLVYLILIVTIEAIRATILQ